jgi:hypothetical protein
MVDTTKALADYADAILAGRRAKNWLFLLLLIVLLGELALFFIARNTDLLTASTTATTRPGVPGREALTYFIAICGFGGMITSVLLSVVLLALTLIMLTVRTLGVGRLTSAFVWSALLAVLMFPWQAILAGPTISSGPDPVAADIKIPGVIYTWSEFNHPTLGARFAMAKEANLPMEVQILRWARFAGFPIVALIILLAIQVKSGKGVRAALGEDQPPIDTTTGA